MNPATDDAWARQLRARLDQELSGLQATRPARDRLVRGIRGNRPGPADRRAGTSVRRRRQWLAVPLAAAAVVCVVVAAWMGQGLVTRGPATGPAGTGGPSAAPTRTAVPTVPEEPTSSENAGVRLIVSPPRAGVTVGRPVRVWLVARRKPFRSATIKWGVTSATTTIDGHCPGDAGTAPPADARHTYPVQGTVLVRALFVPCDGSRVVVVRLAVTVGPRR